MIVVSLLGMIFYNWKIGLGLFMFCCIWFITLEAISARPDNNPSTFIKWQRTQNQRRPVLLCLGDSLTHGNVSGSITPEIPLKLCASLGLPTPDYGTTFAAPLWIVNAGQNMITTHTILHERLHSALGVHPDYILIMIGTNDVRAMYSKIACKSVVRINDLPEKPTLQILERNLTEILQFIRDASPKVEVGLCTLPPMGENLKSPSNKLVREANEIIERVGSKAAERVTIIPVFDQMETILEKRKRFWSWPFDFWLIAGLLQYPFYHVLGLFSWNTLSRPFGYHILSDGLHLNERGRDVVVDLVVEWLSARNVAKAIAVKST